MWLILFYPFLCLSRSFEDAFSFLKLRYSVLYISESNSEWEEIRKEVENITKNSEAYCHEKLDDDSYNLCKDVIDAFQTLHFSDKYQIDKIMKDIPRNSEVLYLFNTANDIELNFNYLVNNKKVVICDPNYQIDNESAKVLTASLPSKATSLIQSILFNHKEIKQQNEEMLKIKIIGNIEYRVSYLVINHYKVLIDNFDLELNTLVLINSQLLHDGASVRATNLLVNSLSHSYIIKDIDAIKSDQTIQVQQYGLFYDDSDQEYSTYSKNDDSNDTDVIYLSYRIVFQKDNWRIFTKMQDENYTTKDHFYFPYEFCDRFNLIVNSLNFDLNVEDESVKTVKDVNITVVNLYDYVTPYILLLDDKLNEVSITTSGQWSKLTSKPKIVVCVEDDVTIKTDVEIEQHKLFSYSPAPPLPDPTKEPSPEGPKYPRASFIYATSNLSYCSDFIEQFITFTLNYTDVCKDDEMIDSFVDYDDCCNYFSSFGEYMCSNGYDINDKLTKIAGYTDTLVIIDGVKDMKVDFSNLRDKMNVVVFNDNDSEDDREKFSKKVLKTFRKTKKIVKKDDDDDDDNWNYPHISIQGNITEKVSSLELMYLNVSFVDHELNVDSLVFHESCFNPNTEPVRTNYFNADLRTHEHVIKKQHRLDLIKVKQYSIAFYEEDISFDPNIYDFLPISLRISFENDRWKILAKKVGEDDYYDTDFSYLPYNYADKLNIIIKSLDFDFHIENSLIQKAQPVNLTIKNYNPYESLNKLLSNDQPILNITTSGSWDSFKNKPEIIVGLPNMIDYSAPETMTIKKEPLYSYKPKTPPENPTNPFIYPVMTYICISSSKSKCAKFQAEYEEEKENCEKLCKEEKYYESYDGGYEECVAFYKTLGDSHISDGKNLDQTLSSISNTTDNLMIMFDINDLTFDFNNLKDQMSVIIVQMDDDDDDDYKKLLSIRKNKRIKSKSNDSYSKVNLVGDISSKVSYLSIYAANLNIINNDLNINTLNLISSTFVDSSKKIRTTNLIVDEDTQDEIIKNIDKINQNDLIKVKQYGFAPSDYNSDKLYSRYFDDDIIKKDFQISFTNDRWLLLAKKNGEKADYQPYSVDGKAFSFLPYSFSDSFNLIAKAFDFDFFVQDSAITKIKPVNISVLKLGIVEETGKLFIHKDVKITSSGNWAAVTDKPEMIFTVDENEVSLQNDSKDVKILKENIYSYVPKSQRTDDGDDGGETSSSEEITSEVITSEEITSAEISSDEVTSSDGGGDEDDGGNKKSDKKKLIIIIAGSVTGLIVIVAIIIIVWYHASYKKKKSFNSSTVQSNSQLNEFLINH